MSCDSHTACPQQSTEVGRRARVELACQAPQRSPPRGHLLVRHRQHAVHGLPGCKCWRVTPSACLGVPLPLKESSDKITDVGTSMQTSTAISTDETKTYPQYTRKESILRPAHTLRNPHTPACCPRVGDCVWTLLPHPPLHSSALHTHLHVALARALEKHMLRPEEGVDAHELLVREQRGAGQQAC
eukprot:363744-Chlamydomonas_euryale.AAC.7